MLRWAARSTQCPATAIISWCCPAANESSHLEAGAKRLPLWRPSMICPVVKPVIRRVTHQLICQGAPLERIIGANSLINQTCLPIGIRGRST